MNSRARIALTESEHKKALRFAASTGTTLSALFRDWTEEFVGETMPDDVPVVDEGTVEVQVVMNPDLKELAQRKANASGTTLRDVIRREIAALDEL